MMKVAGRMALQESVGATDERGGTVKHLAEADSDSTALTSLLPVVL